MLKLRRKVEREVKCDQIRLRGTGQPIQKLCTLKVRRKRSLISEKLQSLLEGLNLLLAALRSLGEAYARVHAARFELIVVSKRRVELLLRALEVFPRFLEVSRLGQLQRILLFGGGGLRIDVRLRVGGELVERTLRLRLAAGRLLLETDEVREDHLEHSENALRGAAHASVRLLPGTRGVAGRRRLLDKGSGGARLGVEVLEHLERRANRRDRRLRVPDGLVVRGFLLGAVLRGLLEGKVERTDLVREVLQLRRELRNLRMKHVRTGREPVDLFSFRVAGLLVRLELRIAPRLLVSLFCGLRRQLLDEVLDHFNDLVERAALSGLDSNLRGEIRKNSALGLLRATLQEDHDAVNGCGALGV